MEPLEPNLVRVHHATPEFRGSQIRPRQIILFDRLFHGMQQGLLFIFLEKEKLMANKYICGFSDWQRVAVYFLSQAKERCILTARALENGDWRSKLDVMESLSKCLGMCVMVLHCERPWLTVKLKGQGWDHLPTNSVIYCSTAQFNHSSDGQKISSCRSCSSLDTQPIFLQLVFFTDSVYLSQGKSVLVSH